MINYQIYRNNFLLRHARTLLLAMLNHFSVIQLHVVLEWAAREGGTPGLDDAECFYATVPDVLLMGHMGREPIAVISAFPAGYHALRGTVPGNGLRTIRNP